MPTRDRVRAGTGETADPAAEAELLARLVVRVAEGARVAFHQLYVRVGPKLYGICLRILGDAAVAEEALQETFWAIWRRAATFDAERGRATTWLSLLARSRSIDRFRATHRMDTLPIEAAGEVADPQAGADQQLDDQGEAARLHACLAMLDPGDAHIIRTAFFHGSTYSEIATRAAQPLGTVKSRIRRALLKLRVCLQ